MIWVPGSGNAGYPGNAVIGQRSSPNTHCGLRLTSVSETPVLNSTQLAKTTLYDAHYKSGYIGLYDPNYGFFIPYSVDEASLSTSGFTASRVHDVYGYMDGLTYSLEAVPWSNNTTEPTRGVQNGVVVKNGEPQKRFRGIVYVNANKEIEWRLGGLSSGGINSKLMIANWDNPIEFGFINGNNDNFWSQTVTNTWRQAAGSSSHQIDFLSLNANQMFYAEYINRPSFASGNASVGIGLNSTSTPYPGTLMTNSAASLTMLRAIFENFVSAGLHYIAPLEFTLNATATWYGDNNVNYQQYGMKFKGWF